MIKPKVGITYLIVRIFLVSLLFVAYKRLIPILTFYVYTRMIKKIKNSKGK